MDSGQVSAHRREAQCYVQSGAEGVRQCAGRGVRSSNLFLHITTWTQLADVAGV